MTTASRRWQSRAGTPIGLACAILLSACAQTVTHKAADLGLERGILPGGLFSHTTFRAEQRSASRLHVYLDGDGVPWTDGRMPAVDPTPRDPLVLELMALDDADAVYLARPCYFGFQTEQACSPDLWTFARYSDAVVASMAQAANRLVSSGGYSDVVLIGYSGGGALARLMAPEIGNLRGILTVAANLDTDAWSETHGYLPLIRSANPANTSPLTDDILHVAVIGDRDTVVPPSVIDSYLSAGQRADVWRYPEADHACCWRSLWPEILARFEDRLAAASP